jgi:hypothetical protein
MTGLMATTSPYRRSGMRLATLCEEACHLDYFEYTFPVRSIIILRMRVRCSGIAHLVCFSA